MTFDLDNLATSISRSFLSRQYQVEMIRERKPQWILLSDDLPLKFQDRLKLIDRWRWNGRHYERSLNAWLDNMDRNRKTLFPLLERTYGKESASVWWGRWRIFFMASAELFGFDNGEQWWVSHYLFERPA